MKHGVQQNFNIFFWQQVGACQGRLEGSQAKNVTSLLLLQEQILCFLSFCLYLYIFRQKFVREAAKKSSFLGGSEKNLICARKLLLNKGNYAIKIDGGRQTDRQSLL